MFVFGFGFMLLCLMGGHLYRGWILIDMGLCIDEVLLVLVYLFPKYKNQNQCCDLVFVGSQ